MTAWMLMTVAASSGARNASRQLSRLATVRCGEEMPRLMGCGEESSCQ